MNFGENIQPNNNEKAGDEIAFGEANLIFKDIEELVKKGNIENIGILSQDLLSFVSRAVNKAANSMGDDIAKRIAKHLLDDITYYNFIDEQSKNENLKAITKSFLEEYIGDKSLAA